MLQRLMPALFIISLLAPGVPVTSPKDAYAQDETPASEELVDEDGKIVSQDEEPKAQSSTGGL